MRCKILSISLYYNAKKMFPFSRSSSLFIYFRSYVEIVKKKKIPQKKKTNKKNDFTVLRFIYVLYLVYS